jgi:hypothetical protein
MWFTSIIHAKVYPYARQPYFSHKIADQAVQDRVFSRWPAHCVLNLGSQANGVYEMGMAKSQDYVSMDYCEPGFSEPENTKPVVLQSAEQMELEMLLEELADFIESEDGILIP